MFFVHGIHGREFVSYSDHTRGVWSVVILLVYELEDYMNCVALGHETEYQTLFFDPKISG